MEKPQEKPITDLIRPGASERVLADINKNLNLDRQKNQKKNEREEQSKPCSIFMELCKEFFKIKKAGLKDYSSDQLRALDAFLVRKAWPWAILQICFSSLPLTAFFIGELVPSILGVVVSISILLLLMDSETSLGYLFQRWLRKRQLGQKYYEELRQLIAEKNPK